MGYFINDLGAFIALEGDHFDAIVADPKCIHPIISLCEPDEVEDRLATTFESLMTSSGADRDAFMLIGVSEGWTFIGTMDDYPSIDLAVAASLAKKFGARTFQLDFSNQYFGGSYAFFNGDGTVQRFVSRPEYSEDAKRSEIGDPLDIEAELPGDWYTNEVLELFHRWGGPNRANEANWQVPMEKSAWLEFDDSVKRVPDPERKRMNEAFYSQQRTVYPKGKPPEPPPPANPAWRHVPWVVLAAVSLYMFLKD